MRVLLAGLAVALMAPAEALADGVIRAEPSNRYATTAVQIAKGEKLNFDNADITAHDVTAEKFKDGKPLFGSDVIDGGKSGPVKRAETLEPGDYEFFCSLHAGMEGKLTVTGEATPSPTPTPEPTIGPPDAKPPEVTVSGEFSTATIRSKRRIALTASTSETATVTFTARIGKRRIGRREVLLRGRRDLAIRLSAKGARRVRRGRKLRIAIVAIDAAGNRRRSKLVVKLP